MAETISKDLKKRGFRFCGPTIVYAFMQACGLVNDHMVTCHRHDASWRRPAAEVMAARKPAEPRAWQRMLSGRRLDLLNPSPLDIEIEDIAHGLARVARWNGQTKGPHAFSVAQHCLLVEALLVHSKTTISTATRRLAALLHDAPEYVIGDMISPFKAALGLDYKVFELKLLAAIHLRFGLPAKTSDTLTRKIKKADRIAAYLEATQLAGFSLDEARSSSGGPPGSMARAASMRCAPLRPMMRKRHMCVNSSSSRRVHMEIIVSPLAAVQLLVNRHKVSHVVSLLGPETPHRDFHRHCRCQSPQAHLSRHSLAGGRLHRAACAIMSRTLITFLKAREGEDPMLIHCWAGISRSTASAFTAMCLYNPRCRRIQAGAAVALALACGDTQPAHRRLCRRYTGAPGPHGRCRRCDRARRRRLSKASFSSGRCC